MFEKQNEREIHLHLPLHSYAHFSINTQVTISVLISFMSVDTSGNTELHNPSIFYYAF